MNTDERRAPATQRVPLGTLVEICGNEPGIPAFEAESVDVSARGMHVRTAYLPELNAPLVCRFEDRGREIIVEGSVAWRREGSRGGEFGIQFTALDSGSVEALRELCGAPAAPSAEPATSDPVEGTSSGSRVRLHIDGLGSPMKARVRGTHDRGVQVGSSLEFLKVGRRLEVEDLERGAKREAFIDSVSVAIDPKTQVPQLVVALRYEAADESTPPPSVIDSEAGATHRSAGEPALAGGTSTAGGTNDDDDDPLDGAPAEEVDDDFDDEGREMRGRLAVAATSAGAAMQRGGAVLAKVSASAASGMGRLFKGASQRVADYRQGRQADAPRRTAVSPSGVLSAEGRHLRRQTAPGAAGESAERAPAPPKTRVKRIAYASAGVALLAAVTVIATRSPAPPPGAEATPAGSAVSVATAENVTKVDEQGNPVAAAADKAAADKAKVPGEEAQSGGISADVPLFGPTPMATMEPAPLGPAPVEEGAAAPAAEPSDEAEKEKAAAKAAVEDEAWQEPAQPVKSSVRPEDVEPWGRGRMDTPTIHRLRLDGAGSAIQGAITPTGFSVVIPGRKVMEAGGGIEKRDARIAKVRTKNGANGATISFQFRDGVPGYRVRLRRDSVEFLVSAPAHSASGATKTNASTAAKKSTVPGKSAPKPAPKR
jgi:hypothetical protein